MNNYEMLNSLSNVAIIEVNDQPVKDWSAFRLSNEADISSAPVRESEGSKFLEIIRDAFIERMEFQRSDAIDKARPWHENEDYVLEIMDDDAVDIIHEVVDGCVPIYTHQIWETFTDLCAWSEDLSELGGPETDMNKNAMTALYMIGCRLGDALWRSYRKELMTS